LYPKQLIRLVDDNTLLQNTLLRLQCLDNVADPMVICHQDHRFMAADTDPDAVLLVLPADHVIDNLPAGGGCGH
jgi:mannose-1-phosphate guanylyltransferase